MSAAPKPDSQALPVPLPEKSYAQRLHDDGTTGARLVTVRGGAIEGWQRVGPFPGIRITRRNRDGAIGDVLDLRQGEVKAFVLAMLGSLDALDAAAILQDAAKRARRTGPRR